MTSLSRQFFMTSVGRQFVTYLRGHCFMTSSSRNYQEDHKNLTKSTSLLDVYLVKFKSIGKFCQIIFVTYLENLNLIYNFNAFYSIELHLPSKIQIDRETSSNYFSGLLRKPEL